MAVVHRIVNALGGMIDVEDPPHGKGTSFIISLPKAGRDSLIDDTRKEQEKTGRDESKMSKTGAENK